MSAYFYWCNQIAAIAISTIGASCLVLIAVWLASFAIDEFLRSTVLLHDFAKFLMEVSKKKKTL